MSDELERAIEPLDDEDLWVRGQAYVNHKRMLEEAEAQLPGLEREFARARYEYEIAQRIRDKTEDPEARQDWDIKTSVAHDLTMMAEHRLAEVAEDAAYYRAMVAEMEADLGDKAQVYGEILADLESDLDEICPFIEDCPFLYDELGYFDPHAPIPFMDDEDVWEEDEEETADDAGAQ